MHLNTKLAAKKIQEVNNKDPSVPLNISKRSEELDAIHPRFHKMKDMAGPCKDVRYWTIAKDNDIEKLVKR